MNITINGKTQNFSPGLTVAELIRHHKLNKDAVVVEINRAIIQKNDYSAVSLKENDAVEIVCFVGGG